MELDRLQKSRLIFDVFQNVEQKQQVEVRAELGIPLMDVVAIQRADSTDVLFESRLIEFKTSNNLSVMILDVSLQEAIPQPISAICPEPRMMESASFFTTWKRRRIQKCRVVATSNHQSPMLTGADVER